MKTFSQFRFWALPVFLCLLFLAGCGGPSYYADVTLLRAPSAPKAHTAAIEPAGGMDGNDLVYSRAADRLAGILKADGRAVVSSPGIADETVRLGFSHRGPVAITRETIRPDFVPVERRGRIRHEVIYVRETETQLWYFTDLLISGTPRAAGKDRTKEVSHGGSRRRCTAATPPPWTGSTPRSRPWPKSSAILRTAGEASLSLRRTGKSRKSRK